MKYLMKNKTILIGGFLAFLIILLGFIASTPLCNYNPACNGAVRDTFFCDILGFFYLFYIGVHILWGMPYSLIFGRFAPVDITNYSTFDIVIWQFKNSIPTFIIGIIIGALIGFLFQKIFKK